MVYTTFNLLCLYINIKYLLCNQCITRCSDQILVIDHNKENIYALQDSLVIYTDREKIRENIDIGCGKIDSTYYL